MPAFACSPAATHPSLTLSSSTPSHGRFPTTETNPATKGTGPAVSEPLASVVTAVSEGQWRQDLSYGGRLALLQSLPVGLLHGVAGRLGLQVPESHLQVRSGCFLRNTHTL